VLDHQRTFGAYGHRDNPQIVRPLAPVINPTDHHIAVVWIMAVLNEMVSVQLEFDSDDFAGSALRARQSGKGVRT